ncbi:MAG: hypothetical protein J0I99_14540 [Devosia sp.]|uniref:DUF6641 family protein n=1 Tax=Devosia sp. TaxID=1871048 RepID=UPI001AC1E40E|nr:DUF6641 family protein [Devosia sp.]MBN9316957.1 hypothetical protein [Devosia sp.]
MNTLNSLNLIALPKVDARDPKHQRRNKLVTQLQQQRSLALDPNFVVPRQKWVKAENGEKQLVNSPKRVKRWWNEDANGNCFLVVRYGSKPLALAAGKHAIAVGTKDKLVEVIDLVTVAAKAGELDEQMAATQKVGQKPPKKG